MDGGGYGQNIGAGYMPVQMGLFITTGLYNSEAPNYHYFGSEPPINSSEINKWGHFTQIVWKSTDTVGCYTQNCTDSPAGLQKVPAGVLPFFTVCNYAPPGMPLSASPFDTLDFLVRIFANNYLPVGNVIGPDSFTANVGAPIDLPSVGPDYGCPTDENCLS